MKVTVCQLTNDPGALQEEWQALVEHVETEGSDFVLLPEMAFYPWLPETDKVDPTAWEASVQTHAMWMDRLGDLSAPKIAGTRPVIRNGRRFNEGFLWTAERGYQGVHRKYYLPNEKYFWEATWYERGEKTFVPGQIGDLKVGFLICTELWFNYYAREYAKQGVDIIICPRATPAGSVEKWVAGGQTAAVVAGAFCLSSNFGGWGPQLEWGGTGWVIEPEAGKVLGVTSSETPYLTIEIDLEEAKAAKRTYPRYVRD